MVPQTPQRLAPVVRYVVVLCIDLDCIMRACAILLQRRVPLAMKHFHQMLFLCAALATTSIATDSQNTYANCSTNFTVLENALFETSDNIFQLTTTYFHPDVENPLYVDVHYNFSDSSTETQHYIWTTSALYFIVRPPALIYLSQFYSDIHEKRQADLTLQLPADCAELANDTSSEKENFLFVLTQRVRCNMHYCMHCLSSFKLVGSILKVKWPFPEGGERGLAPRG